MTVWPPGFRRVPDADWTRAPVEELAAKYDLVDHHGWYANLDPTVEAVKRALPEGGVLVDYSGGTGLLVGRLLDAVERASWGVVVVDSSPKFLRLALEKFRDDGRVAFRLVRWLKDERRLQYVDEVLDLGRPVDVLVSANAVHLYADLGGTFASWRRVLAEGGTVHVQSGNVAGDLPEGGWIIDATVEAIAEAARDVAREDARFAPYAPLLDDAERMRRYDAYRRKVFPPPRPLSTYVGALERAGLRVERVERRLVPAKTADWTRFLAVYADAILGWVGGSEKVEGAPPSDAALVDREALLRRAAERVFAGRERFDAVWTYVTCCA